MRMTVCNMEHGICKQEGFLFVCSLQGLGIGFRFVLGVLGESSVKCDFL